MPIQRKLYIMGTSYIHSDVNFLTRTWVKLNRFEGLGPLWNSLFFTLASQSFDFCQSFEVGPCASFHGWIFTVWSWNIMLLPSIFKLKVSEFDRFLFSCFFHLNLAIKDRKKFTTFESFLCHRNCPKYVDNLGIAGTEWEKVFRQCFVWHTSISDRVSCGCIVVITFILIRYLGLEAMITTINSSRYLTVYFQVLPFILNFSRLNDFFQLIESVLYIYSTVLIYAMVTSTLCYIHYSWTNFCMW